MNLDNVIKFTLKNSWAAVLGALLANAGWLPWSSWQYWMWFCLILATIYARDWPNGIWIEKRKKNLNNVAPVYSKTSHSIILLEDDTFNFRRVHQEVMDAVVQYFINEQPPFCEQRINSMGKYYVLRMTPCK